jgi:hypothetical protein
MQSNKALAAITNTIQEVPFGTSAGFATGLTGTRGVNLGAELPAFRAGFKAGRSKWAAGRIVDLPFGPH